MQSARATTDNQVPLRAEAEQSSVRREKTTLVLTSGLLVLAFAVASAIQTVVVYRIGFPRGASSLWEPLLPRLAVNLLCTGAFVAALWFSRIERRRGAGLVATVISIALVAALLRYGLQLLFRLYKNPLGSALVDFGVGVVVVCLALCLGLVLTASQRKLRAQELAYAHQKLRAASALTALQAEELRVRREVAEGLHGTVQQRIVFIETRLDAIVGALSAALADGVWEPHVPEAIEQLRGMRLELDTLREVDVREVSQLLYPSGIELGLAQAMRMMMRRVPSTIATDVTIDASVLRADDPEGSQVEVAQRMLLVRVLEEAISNALRHGHASALELELRVEHETVHLVFDDNGRGLSGGWQKLNGLSQLRERLEAVGGSLQLSDCPSGGTRLSAALPLGPASG